MNPEGQQEPAPGAHASRPPERKERRRAPRRQAQVSPADAGVPLQPAPETPRVAYPQELPISAHRDRIVELLRAHNTIILAGETGSGKTTQLPKMLVEAGLADKGRIALTQPRRVAALAVSRRIAEELEVEWGGFVGCQIRFNDTSSPRTRIKVMTDGILLNEIQHDPLLRAYSAVILDEAHERSLNMDFLLGHFRRIRDRRPDLRVIVTSATLDLEAFGEAFPGAPVVQVEGRTYPVEVYWRPLDSMREEAGDVSYTEAAAQTARDIAAMGERGDMLIFMPTERDIRETCALLEKHGPHPAEVLPLFGRLTAGEQQRIFKPSNRRKIVVSTNVAETSLTIPGIRFVIDSGLARISRHSPQTRTQRLPVEPVSQSSADQRKGRCGRVADGICFRLYSEEDYAARPRQTDPEILRSNLAGVILRMLAFRLGDIRDFPFVNPPQERAIRAGFVQLRELGALDADDRLTPLGRQMARLPVDPTFARILIQARQERCLREVLVIAAGLSIMDPRERPLAEAAQADLMHKPFLHPESDFLTLLAIWDAYHDECERLSQSRLRKFCKAHFLNYMRMQEWRDLHNQLSRAMDDIDQLEVNTHPASYETVHRSILSGLLGNVAHLDKDGLYMATHSRKIALFPGSGLAKRQTEAQRAKQRRKPGDPVPVKAPRLPEWIVCASWMETSRLFARTVARVRPDWILEFGRHLLDTSHTEPFWDEDSCRALIKERVRLYGLEISCRSVGLTRFEPALATDMFVRNALVPDLVPEPFPFIAHNRGIRTRVEERQLRLRRFSSTVIEDRLASFYLDRISGVGSVPDLHRFCREQRENETHCLRLRERDLDDAPDADSSAFPASVRVGGRDFPIHYRQEPGGEADGASVELPAELHPALPEGFLDWLVPGYLPERIEAMLRGLPKSVRVALFPIADKAAELARELPEAQGTTLAQWLSSELYRRWQVRAGSTDFALADVPERLLPRLVLVDDKGEPVGAARGLLPLREAWLAERDRTIKAALSPKAAKGQPATAKASQQPATGKPAAPAVAQTQQQGGRDLWSSLCREHESGPYSDWTFTDQQLNLPAGTAAGVPLFAWPGLQSESKGTFLRLFRSRDEAEAATAEGILALGATALRSELAAVDGNLTYDLKALHLLYLPLGKGDALLANSKRLLRRHLLLTPPLLPLTRAAWDARIQQARQRARTLPAEYIPLLKRILDTRQTLVSAGEKAYPGAATDVTALIPADFLATVTYADLPRLDRWLKGRLMRADRRRVSPPKDLDKSKRLAEFEPRMAALDKLKPLTPEQSSAIRECRRLWEELRLSIFAQELGTEGKVSPQILTQQLHAVSEAFGLPAQGKKL